MRAIPLPDLSKGATLKNFRTKWIVFLACLFLAMALLASVVVVYHLPPRLFGLLYLLLLVSAFLAAKYFVVRREDSPEQRVEQSNEGLVDEATRQRLRQGLLSAKYFLALFTLGFVVFIVELVTGSLNVPLWAELESALIGLVFWFWALRQVVHFRRRLGQSRT